MSDIKTLKDLKIQGVERYGICNYCEKVIRAEAVKWVKEDLKELGLYPRDEIIIRWMKRLDIKEEDLK